MQRWLLLAASPANMSQRAFSVAISEAAITTIVLLLWVGGVIFNAARPLYSNYVHRGQETRSHGREQALMYLLFFLAHGLLHDPGRSIGGGGPDGAWLLFTWMGFGSSCCKKHLLESFIEARFVGASPQLMRPCSEQEIRCPSDAVSIGHAETSRDRAPQAPLRGEMDVSPEAWTRTREIAALGSRDERGRGPGCAGSVAGFCWVLRAERQQCTAEHVSSLSPEARVQCAVQGALRAVLRHVVVAAF